MLKLPFLPFKLLHLVVRVVGLKNSLLIAVGVGIGLLVAPTTGAELRDRLADRLAGVPGAADPVVIAERDLSL